MRWTTPVGGAAEGAADAKPIMAVAATMMEVKATILIVLLIGLDD